MARIRTIKPEFWTDSFMVQLPPLLRLIYIALWTAADDYGYIRDEVERISMELMPREDPNDVDDAIQFFVVSGRIEEYCDQDGNVFYRIHKWEDHQKIDHPTKSKIYRENSRKLSIPNNVRREIAEKYGCKPGETVEATCYYCGAKGGVHWFRHYNGNPSAWVGFPGLEMDHLISEEEGGETASKNIVLSCRYCNRSKGTKDWLKFLLDINGRNIHDTSIILDNNSAGREGKGIGVEGNGREKEKPTRLIDPLKSFGPTVGASCIMTEKDLRDQMTGQIFIEQSCIALGCDEDAFKTHLETWIKTKVATGDFIYPISKLKTYCLSDFKKSTNGRGVKTSILADDTSKFAEILEQSRRK